MRDRTLGTRIIYIRSGRGSACEGGPAGTGMSEDLQAIKQIHDKVKDKVSLEEFKSRIDGKIKEHYGLLSEIGAAKLLAREMGATFEAPPQMSLKIKNLVPGMESVDVAGRVVSIYGVRSFNRESFSGKVSNILVMDETGSVRVVLWGEKAEPVERGTINRGDIVQIRSGYTRTGLSGEVEVHVGRRGRILVNPAISEPMPELQETKVKIKDIQVGMRDVTVEGVISAISNVRTFNRPDGAGGKVATVFLKDDTGETRVSLWNEKAEGLERIPKGSLVRIVGAYVKGGLNERPELHCSSSSQIVLIEPSKDLQFGSVQSVVRISELTDNMPSVDIRGRVERVLGRRSFTRLNGQEGKVANVIVSDGSGQVRVVLWGNAADAAAALEEGSRVTVENAYTKFGMNQELEVHVGWRGRLLVEEEEFIPMVCDLVRGMQGLTLEVGIVEVGLPEEFNDAKLISAVVGDATGRVPAVFWDGHVDPVQELEAGRGLRIRNAKVNDLGEIQVLPESSLEVLDKKVEVLNEDEPKMGLISALQAGRLCRIRACPVALTDLRYTNSFGPDSLLCTCVLDDGSGLIPAIIFGDRCAKLLKDGTGRSIEELRSGFRKGVDMVFIGVVVDGRLRVSGIEVPDPRREAEELIKELKEAS